MVTDKSQLTSAEMGKLWAAYVGNTMGKCMLSYFLEQVDDRDIKNVLKYALGLCKAYIQEVETIFNQANFPVPIGFTDDDVNLEAPRLFQDEFYLHYLQYLGKAGMSIYSVAIPLVTRKDVRDFFMSALDATAKLMSDVNDALMAKDALMNAPIIQPPKSVDFVTNQSFLKGFFGDVRSLNGLETAHLYGNINNDITSKALIIGFRQGAKNEKIKKYLERGEQLNQKHIEKFSEKLTKDNLPSPSLLDHLVTSSTVPPFSEKLMVFHKIDMFSMKIREYAYGASLSGRRDLSVLYGKCQLDVSLYAEDGANILIDHGWMEQPPETINREKLVTE
ncbi:DUF3231 family protein [Paenibacillus sp. N4]|uniref:DUF3231 family protein n=1 Tax=Paenibacillus vietnamensis TaxID=2590547 RepID=UPI001CD161CB|nr:DUF3231 family protein [Paenibacillus vietnamensis]MCA0757244.1 DUF3231 family protein [Paenibacillus vietnamensis]